MQKITQPGFCYRCRCPGCTRGREKEAIAIGELLNSAGGNGLTDRELRQKSHFYGHVLHNEAQRREFMVWMNQTGPVASGGANYQTATEVWVKRSNGRTAFAWVSDDMLKD